MYIIGSVTNIDVVLVEVQPPVGRLDLEVILCEGIASLVESFISLMLEWQTLPLFRCGTHYILAITAAIIGIMKTLRLITANGRRLPYYPIIYYTGNIPYYTSTILYYTILYCTIMYYTSTILYYTILYHSTSSENI
uniref:Uncharacterized protein n=1 Tax=Glossina pallidipes TaxID=7398 RepID=A0A1A9ZA70_GLOPL